MRRPHFPSDERPGTSVFCKNAAGEVFHTYSSYGRGLDLLIGAYNFLDIAPKGRDEDGLRYGMAWVRHHDKYEGAVVDPAAALSGTQIIRRVFRVVLRLSGVTESREKMPG